MLLIDYRKEKNKLTLYSFSCNLKCPNCNISPLFTEENILGNSTDIIKSKLDRDITHVTFTGGEPTIHKLELLDTLILCKQQGLQTKIVTNGTNPSIISMLNDYDLVDEYDVVIKCAKDFKKYLGVTDEEYFHKVDKTINNIIDNSIKFNLVIPKYLNKSNLMIIKKYMKIKESSHNIKISYSRESN